MDCSDFPDTRERWPWLNQDLVRRPSKLLALYLHGDISASDFYEAGSLIFQYLAPRSNQRHKANEELWGNLTWSIQSDRSTHPKLFRLLEPSMRLERLMPEKYGVGPRGTTTNPQGRASILERLDSEFEQVLRVPLFNDHFIEHPPALLHVNEFAARLVGMGVRNLMLHGLRVLINGLETDPPDRFPYAEQSRTFGAIRSKVLLLRSPEAHDLEIPAAAQWIFHAGHVIYSCRMRDIPSWEPLRPGPLYSGPDMMCEARWTVWKERFETISRKQDIDDATKEIAIRAAATMRAIEEDPMWQPGYKCWEMFQDQEASRNANLNQKIGPD